MLSVLPLAREISDNDGGGSLQACQKINLVGVDLTFGCISDQDIISKLLANEIIIIKKIFERNWCRANAFIYDI